MYNNTMKNQIPNPVIEQADLESSNSNPKNINIFGLKIDFKVIIQFFLFGLIGVSNTLISYVLYLFFLSIHLHYLIGNALAFIISIFNSFYWNNKYVFKSKDKTSKKSQLMILGRTFIVYGFSGLILSTMFLYIFINYFQVSKYIAPFLVLFITVPLNFVLNKIWAFKNRS